MDYFLFSVTPPVPPFLDLGSMDLEFSAFIKLNLLEVFLEIRKSFFIKDVSKSVVRIEDGLGFCGFW